jgi:hypothetical protein
MIYKFKSKAAGDVIMMGPTGDAVLRAAGREPAPKGIFEPAALPAARAAIERAVDDDDAARAEAEAKARAEGAEPPRADGIGLRQRAWPLVEMMKRAEAAGEPIVWGV